MLFVLLSCFLAGVLVPGMRWLAVVTVLISCAGLLLLPAIETARPAARRMQCFNNLKQISLALHSYHDTFGRFPPAYVADEKGRPLYSWRVLILPYLEQKTIFDQWRLDEPWDSPSNIALSQVPICAFQCPSEKPSNGNIAPTMTSYVAVVGPDTLWPGDK